MTTFDLELQIKNWRKQLYRQQNLEPGYIEELECSLRDRIEDYLIRGIPEEKAFEKASEKVFPSAEAASSEYRKVVGRQYRLPLPNWLETDLFFLLPNYFKIAIRNITRQKFYSSINFIGLVIGLLFSYLAGLYIYYETSFDRFHTDANRIYRLGRHFRSQDYSVMSYNGYYSAPPRVQMKQVDGIRQAVGVESACQFFAFGRAQFVEQGTKRLPVKDILHTNTPKAFFEFFDWEFLKGSAVQFNNTLNSVVLTRSIANRIYGSTWKSDPELLERELTVDDSVYRVVGIIEDIPPNSHYTFSLALHKKKIEYWGARTYIRLTKKADPDQVRKRIDANMANINTRLAKSELFGGTILQPLPSIHLYSNLLYEMKTPGDLRYIYMFAVIAGIILFITITNYTNLSIAMNASRAREIGMRKVFGAKRLNVIGQFLLEACLLALLAVPFVLMLLDLLVPPFNQFMGTSIEQALLYDLRFLLLLPLGAILVGILSGFYPAFYLSHQRIQALFAGNTIRKNKKGVNARKSLIVFQFSLLIGLCSLTLFVNQQLGYIQNKDLGYKKEGIMYVFLEEAENYPAFRQELLKLPEVMGVGAGSFLGRPNFNQTTYKLEGTDQVFDDAYNLSMDINAVRLFGIKTSVNEQVQNPSLAPDTMILINETAVQKLTTAFGIERGALLEQRIIEEPEYVRDNGRVGFPFKVGGFFEDINMLSLKEPITPYFLTVVKEAMAAGRVILSFDARKTSKILEKIKSTHAKLNESLPFRYSFQSENIARLYEKEQKVGKLTVFLSFIAFFVAVIGLIALTAFLTTLKRKEIGIRKILGASVWEIIRLFNKEYLILIGIALLIAAPLAYYATSAWLANFAYRIEINLWVFVVSALVTLAIAMAAVSLMTYRVAVADPAEAIQENQ